MADRFRRTCGRHHGAVLEPVGDEGLRCPEGHDIGAQGGSWAVTDAVTGQVVAVASRARVILSEEMGDRIADVLRELAQADAEQGEYRVVTHAA